jgi:hypothetical protein
MRKSDAAAVQLEDELMAAARASVDVHTSDTAEMITNQKR